MKLFRRSVPALAAISLSTFVSACGAGSASNGVDSQSPAQAESNLTSALNKVTAVRMTTRASKGGVTDVQVLETDKTSGRQTIQVGAHQATIIATPKAVYIKADAALLSSDFAMTPQEASKEAGKWLYFSSSAPQYQVLARGLTVGVLSKELALTSVSKTPRPKLGGKQVVALKGRSAGANGSLTLYLPTSGPLLPVGGELSAPGVKLALSFSNWDKAITVTAPRSASPFPLSAPPSGASTGASAPSAGKG